MRIAAIVIGAAVLAGCRDGERGIRSSADSARDVTVATGTTTGPRVAPRVDVAPCIAYEDTVVLRGRLFRRTYPGPPNYESVARGDEAETAFYLALDAPLCARTAFPGREDPTDTPRDSVRIVQLVLDSAGYARLRPKLGRVVELRGRTFSQHTGHHHAQVLLDLLGVTAAASAR